MKRLILMGGRPWLSEEGGKKFVDVLFRYFPKQAKVAFCMFAQSESDWAETQKVNREMFVRFAGKRRLEYQTIMPESIAAVSAWADIVYIPGGDPFVLQEKLAACGDIAKLWDGKVIAGSSAGADIFCTAYTYLRNKTMGTGFDWVHATCIPHWRGAFEAYTDKDWDWVEAESLKKYPDLPLLCIPESHFVEFTVN